ncbi:MAG TPA: prepilin-type N-terminal cleavage/methylation domain-containing protein [Gemmatimonadaceae bacterium]|nr:prepilin-type N-terminal cleavage/methylation domain-containing protein [Gemmatimonadaceae bacterium]
MRLHRAGLTLIEVVVAILVFSAGALGLAAATAAITRQMTASLLRSRAAGIARTRDETAHASGCASVSGGAEAQQGVSSTWRVSPGSVVTLDQDIERPTPIASRTDRFLSAIPCD